MYYVYIIKSIGEDWHYVGLTNSVSKRLHQHNLGQTTSSKAHRPFKLIYSKSFTDRIGARDYEKFLKIHSNKEKLIKSL